MWIQGFDWAVTDENRNAIALDLLHHSNIIDPNKRELFYPIARRLFAASNDTRSGKMPSVIGVPVEGDSPLLVNVMYQNLTDSVQKVFLRLFFSYEKKKNLIGPVDVYTVYLDAGGPLLPRDFDVPSGRMTKSYAANPIANGKLWAIGGHLHDYGQMIKLVDSTSNHVIWEAEPEEGGDGYVKSSPMEVFYIPKKIKKGHRYAIVAVYDNPLDHPSPDKGMGTIGAIFRPSDESELWYKPDYDNELYIEDMRTMLEAPLKGHDHHKMKHGSSHN
ncbi:MAG: hypothetical protein HC906_09490 [Bacteroidales bacterium]|nr:hypothetical protein [Bacteroidales bacterium]